MIRKEHLRNVGCPNEDRQVNNSDSERDEIRNQMYIGKHHGLRGREYFIGVGGWKQGMLQRGRADLIEI